MKKRISVIFVVLAFACGGLLAQNISSSIVGNVTDASGGGMAGASVKITQIQTNDSRSVTTNDDGGYTISTVIPGIYRVEVTRPGFRTFSLAPNGRRTSESGRSRRKLFTEWSDSPTFRLSSGPTLLPT